MATKLELPATVSLTQGLSEEKVTIARKEPWEAMRTLGVRPAPNGNYQQEANFLKTKADTYAARLIVSNLTRMDTFIFHRSTYTPSLTYSLPVTTLSKSQLNKIQKKSVMAILDKLGVNRHFPRRVTFGPRELGGLFLLDMSVEQGVRQVQHFMNHIFAFDSVGELMLIELRALQIESGCGHHLLEAPSIDIPYLTPCWIHSMRQFMAENRLKLEVTQAKKIPLCRERDRYLMDDFRHLNIFSDSDLYDINRCRIFLKVTTLSDITDGLGRCITEEAFKCRAFTDRQSPLLWPRQPVLTTQQKNLWKKALEAAYTSTGRVLHEPLGMWIAQSNMNWNAYYDTGSHTVRLINDGTDADFTVTVERRLTLAAERIPSVLQPVSMIPWHQLIPATVVNASDSKVTISLFRPRTSTQSILVQPPRSFEEHVQRLPEMQQRLLLQFEFVPGGERALCECLQSHRKLRLASDGSLDPHRELASFGWLLIGNGNVLVRGSGPVDGVPDLLSSTRAELFGMGACLEMIHQLCSFYSILGCRSQIQIFVDNKAAIKQVNRTRRPVSRKRRICHDLDIITHISM
jgi:hypothetical protein